MKRIAFFVEGQTEQIFVNRLVRYLLGSKNTNIIQRKVKGGTNVPRTEMTRHMSLAIKPDYEVLIMDCGSDNRVKSEMLDNFETLSKNNYSMLVGLRDLYPLPLEEQERLEKGLRFLPPNYKKLPIKFDVVLAVREIETWFIAETTHYEKIDKKLTCEYIQRRLGFNPQQIDPISIQHPATTLNKIYKLVGHSYAKRYDQTVRMVNRLDIKYITEELRYKVKAINKLLSIIERFKKLEEVECKRQKELN